MSNEDIDQPGSFTIARSHQFWDLSGSRNVGIFNGAILVVVPLDAFVDTLGKAVASKQIHHGIDHVETADLLVAHFFDIAEYFILFLFEEKNGTSLIFGDRDGKFNGGPDGPQDQTQNNDPPPCSNGMEVVRKFIALGAGISTDI